MSGDMEGNQLAEYGSYNDFVGLSFQEALAEIEDFFSNAVQDRGGDGAAPPTMQPASAGELDLPSHAFTNFNVNPELDFTPFLLEPLPSFQPDNEYQIGNSFVQESSFIDDSAFAPQPPLVTSQTAGQHTTFATPHALTRPSTELHTPFTPVKSGTAMDANASPPSSPPHVNHLTKSNNGIGAPTTNNTVPSPDPPELFLPSSGSKHSLYDEMRSEETPREDKLRRARLAAAPIPIKVKAKSAPVTQNDFGQERHDSAVAMMSPAEGVEYAMNVLSNVHGQLATAEEKQKQKKPRFRSQLQAAKEELDASADVPDHADGKKRKSAFDPTNHPQQLDLSLPMPLEEDVQAHKRAKRTDIEAEATRHDLQGASTLPVNTLSGPDAHDSSAADNAAPAPASKRERYSLGRKEVKNLLPRGQQKDEQQQPDPPNGRRKTRAQKQQEDAAAAAAAATTAQAQETATALKAKRGGRKGGKKGGRQR